MTKRIYTKIIEDCDHCQFRFFFRCQKVMNEDGLYRQIDDKAQIPDWCPLPIKEE